MGDLSGLTSSVLDFLRKEEAAFSKMTGHAGRGLLAEHSLRVARLARRIALAIGGDGEIAYVAGLLHDLGKFRRKMFRKEEIEEHVSMELAKEFLIRSGFEEDFIAAVLSAIGDLADKMPRTKEAAALYDADILDKTGAHGFLNVVAKYSSRGETVLEIVEKRASGDITYLVNLPDILTTSHAREISHKYRERGLRIYEWLFDELEELGFEFDREELLVNGARIVLIKRKLCPCSGNSPSFKYKVKRGVKDDVIEFEVFCRCGWSVVFGFCIPIIFEKPLY